MSLRRALHYDQKLNVRYPEFREPIKNNDKCTIAEIYKTRRPGQKVECGAVGPSSIKHIYTGIPNFYPIRRKCHPRDSLYKEDLSQFIPAGGVEKRQSYTYKIYPFTHRHVRELREYADYSIPIEYVDVRHMTKIPVKTSTSLDPGYTC